MLTWEVSRGGSNSDDFEQLQQCEGNKLHKMCSGRCNNSLESVLLDIPLKDMMGRVHGRQEHKKTSILTVV